MTETAPNQEAIKPRAISFFDGQNLFRRAKTAFGYYYPNYDPLKLTKAICANTGWQNAGVRFYTGVPSHKYDPDGQAKWSRRLRAFSQRGITITKRELRYVSEKTEINGQQKTIMIPHEKGIDVRIALDAVRCTLRNELDVVLIFSQDQDLAEVALDIKEIAAQQKREVTVVSAYPKAEDRLGGIYNTEWIPFDKELYDKCLDPIDYGLQVVKKKSRGRS